MLDTMRFDAAWSGVFDEWDRLLVDSSIRLTQRRAGDLSVSDDLYLGLLFVAKAIRHSHAAVALDEVGFGRLFEQLMVERGRDGNEEFVGAGVDQTKLRQALWTADPRLIEPVDLAQPQVALGGSPFVLSTDGSTPMFVATRRFAVAECDITTRLLAATTDLLVEPSAASLPSSADVIAAADPAFLNDGVRAFLDCAMTRSISVLTGGPGTGKTTAIATLLRGLGEIGRREGRHFTIALCAPTAKAAVRMREALDNAFGERGLAEYEEELAIDPRSGSVHRLLEIRPDASVSTVELGCDMVIVDEVSMLELTLLDQVLRSSVRSHVILAGDPDQLVSVEVGAVLRDIVEAGDEPGAPLESLVTRLVASHRSNDAIVELASAINRGDKAAFDEALDEHPAVLTLASSSNSSLGDVVEQAVELRRVAIAGDEPTALATLGSQVVLCANREGDRSVAWWNRKVEDALARRFPGGSDETQRFAVGTPIMVLKNEASATAELAERLSNGDVGVVCATDDVPDVVFLPVSAAPRRRKLRMIDQATAAWAFTIHKSQGSEYERVVVSLPERPNRILSRELLYTAVTRAKHAVVIIGSSEVIDAALARRVERVSGLTERLVARAAD